MSVARQVKQTFDLDGIAAAAERLGFAVERNAQAVGYWSGSPMHNGKKFPLVIKGKGGRYDIGFTEEEMIFDDHGGNTSKTLGKVLPEYYRDTIEMNGYQIEEVSTAGNEITIKVQA